MNYGITKREELQRGCMRYRRLLGAALIGILVFGGLVSCSQPGGPTTTLTGSEFDTIREAADIYMNSGKPLYITAQELHDSMMAVAAGTPGFQIEWYDPLTYPTGPFIVDVRGASPEMPDLYLAGHIPGAIHIPWQRCYCHTQRTRL